MLYARVYQRVLRPGLAVFSRQATDQPAKLQRRFTVMNDAFNSWSDTADRPHASLT